MRISIIACGESGALWDGKGPSLGVNDCEKFGNPVDYLLLLNTRGKFADERLKFIEGSKPRMCYSHLRGWEKHFTNFTLIDTKPWPGTEIRQGVIYHSKTSPFCAMSLAHAMGYNEIVLYGVDFQTHKSWTPAKPNFEQECIRYERFAEMLEEHGTKVYTIRKANLNLPLYEAT